MGVAERRGSQGLMGRRQLTERLGLPTDRGPRIFVASAHADDAEIGAAGTIARLLSERPDAEITWLVLAAPDSLRAAEARASAERQYSQRAASGAAGAPQFGHRSAWISLIFAP